MPRWSLIAAAIAASAGCGASAPIERQDRVAIQNGRSIDVRVVLETRRGRDADRYLRAGASAARTLALWFGDAQPAALQIVDSAGAEPSVQPAIVVPPVPFWSARAAMAPELAVGRAVSRRYWTSLIDGALLPSSLLDGLVEYSARRIAEPLFQSENQPPGYAMVEARSFGGLVPSLISVRLMPEAGSRDVRTLSTLERWLSRPVLDGALADFVEQWRARRPKVGDFERAISDASGQDLSWLFAQTIDRPAAFDYAIGQLSSRREPEGQFMTTVVVQRLGDGIFTGTATPRAGPFESGKGVAVQVTFEDGQQVHDTWDGRDVERTFVYRGPSPAVSAEVDPDRVIALDTHRTNDSRTLRPRAAVAARRWAARWSIWLENVLLTWSFLV